MKLLIVDDEVIIRRGLSTVIPWKEHGFTLLKPAASAEEALLRFPGEQPQIVFTDIQMTGKNGLDMTAEIKEAYPQTEIVVLSVHDQFQFTQQAIRYGVADYILKTSSPEEIINAAVKARSRILSRSQQRLKNKADEHRIRQNGVLEDLLLNGRIPASGKQNELDSLLAGIGSSLDKPLPPLQVLMISLLSDSGQQVSLTDEAVSSVEQHLKRLFPAAMLRQEHNMLAVISLHAVTNPNSKLLEAAGHIERKLDQRLFISAGPVVQSLQQLHASYIQAKQTHGYRGFVGGGRLVTSEQVQGRKGIDLARSPEDEARLIRALKSGERDNLHLLAEELCTEAQANPQATPESFHAYIQLLLMTGYRWLERSARESGAEMPAAGLRVPSLKTLLSDPEGVLTRHLEEMMDIYLTWSDNTNRYIKEAIAFIRGNLVHNITLQQVAAHTHVHPNYLSDLFKRETGRNYIEFITAERMERAMAALSGTTLRVKEIARSVGYEDMKYFTQLFKRHTGLTPSEYRSNC
ncbi:response regulator [Paenibacillus sp. P96]|uniref:Response regulator n=1 Tax=Paenibacillus zeirhizosphaerae TaxID=2987519 RepID=A0ABT9FNA9_9BACL|nr:helix-turn-helix domain-containing protein [Paenibacillus sp. P96]MDP4095892.1 response regulator [Paenibacillus sp. P96]